MHSAMALTSFRIVQCYLITFAVKICQSCPRTLLSVACLKELLWQGEKQRQMLQLTPTTTYLSIWQTLSALKSVFDTNFHSIVIKSPGLTHHQLCLPQKT